MNKTRLIFLNTFILFVAAGSVFGQVQFVESVLYPQSAPTGQADADINIPFSSCDRIASDNGRYVVFDSPATNLVAGDTNGYRDVFVRDTVNNVTRRISMHNDGSELTGDSQDGCISGDGRYVVYTSSANPTTDAEHDGIDVYLYDRLTNTQRSISQPRVPCSPCGGDAVKPTIASDGSYIAFTAASAYLTTEASVNYEVYRYDIANGSIDLISQNTDGTASTASFLEGASISDTGRYVAFVSASGNIVAGDTNGYSDVFVFDEVTDSISRVSLDENGDEVSGLNTYNDIKIAGSGSHVLFISNFVDLMSADTNGIADIYVHRLSDGSLELASQSTSGALTTSYQYYAPSISRDGRKVAFRAGDGIFAGVTGQIAESQFVRNLSASTTSRIVPDLSVAGNSYVARISADGNSLRYTSTGAAEVAGDNNGNVDLFGVQLGTLGKTLISRANTTVSAAPIANGDTVAYHIAQRAISDDGRYVVFTSQASNLDPQQTPTPYHDSSHVYLADRLTGENIMVDVPDLSLGVVDSQLISWNASLSADGRYVVYSSSRNNLVAGDTNDKSDIFLWDRTTRSNRRLTVNAFGTQADADSLFPAISADGQHVVFTSDATNLTTDLLSSSDNVFHIDVSTNVISLISKDSSGNAADNTSELSAISGDGRYVVFDSRASNLVANDTNGETDVFLHDRSTGQTTRISRASGGGEGDDDSYYPSISDDGSTILFASEADNLGDSPSDDPNDCDFFVHTPATGITETVGKNSSGIELAGDIISCYGVYAGLSADGRYAMFTTPASNMVHTGDTADGNATIDVFVRDRDTDITRRVSQDGTGQESSDASLGMGISADGRYVSVYGVGREWQLDGGYRAYKSYAMSTSPFVMELEGFAEPTTSAVNPNSLSGATVGNPQTLQIRVAGDSNRPADGMIVVYADDGQTCRSNTLSNLAAATAVGFTCDMTFAAAGDYDLRISYRLSDTHASSATTATLTVAAGAPNTAPTADAQSVNVDENDSVIITLTGNDADGDTLSYAIVTPPSNGTLSGTLPNVTYTPNADYVGNDSFQFKVNDGTAGSAPTTVNITVNAVAPIEVIFSNGFEESP